MVQVLIRNLHEDRARLGEQITRQQQTVAQIGEVRVQPQLPGIPVSLDHLRLAGQGLVVVVADVALADERLKIGAELHAVGRIDVDHLHLPAEILVVQQRVHHHQRITEDHAVLPAVGVFVGLHQLFGEGTVGVAEEAEEVELLVSLVAGDAVENRLGGETLMNEEGEGRHLEGEAFGLAGPVEKGALQRFELADCVGQAVNA